MAKIISFFIFVPPEINRVHYPVRKNRAKVLFAIFSNSRYRLLTSGSDFLLAVYGAQAGRAAFFSFLFAYMRIFVYLCAKFQNYGRDLHANAKYP